MALRLPEPVEAAPLAKDERFDRIFTLERALLDAEPRFEKAKSAVERARAEAAEHAAERARVFLADVRALTDADARGAEIVEISLPHSPYGIAVYYTVAIAEASSNLARYDGVRYGHRVPARDLSSMYLRTRAAFGAELKRRIMLGTYVLSAGYYEAFYGKGTAVRARIRGDFDRAFAEIDALLCPTTPTPAFPIGEKTDDPLAMYLADIYTVTINLAGTPGISIPAGFTSDGLPVGCQLVAPHFEEARLLKASYAYEQAYTIDRKPKN